MIMEKLIELFAKVEAAIDARLDLARPEGFQGQASIDISREGATKPQKEHQD
jgi:hypothetical protein